jgi:hypothetical protein
MYWFAGDVTFSLKGMSEENVVENVMEIQTHVGVLVTRICWLEN